MDWSTVAQAYFGSGGGKGGLGDSGGRISPVIVGTGASKIAAAMPSGMDMTGSSARDLLPGISPDPMITSGSTNIAGIRVPTDQLFLGLAVLAFVLLLKRKKA